jgi:hypothetical protein
MECFQRRLSSVIGVDNLHCPVRGSEAQICSALEPVELAVTRILSRIHSLLLLPFPTLLIKERNEIIIARFEASESQAVLARVFGITYQRVHQIVRGKHR